MPAKGRYKNPICPACGENKPTSLKRLPECKACAALVKKLRYERAKYKRDGEQKRKKCRDYHWANRQAQTQKMRERYKRDPESYRIRGKESYRKNRKKVLARAKARQDLLRAVAPEILREYARRHFQRYPHKRTALAAAYRAKLSRATPEWADPAAIREVYALAELMTRLLGRKYTVDHYYPLKGKQVCGLHVEQNLRVVSEAENRAKSNKMPLS